MIWSHILCHLLKSEGYLVIPITVFWCDFVAFLVGFSIFIFDKEICKYFWSSNFSSSLRFWGEWGYFYGCGCLSELTSLLYCKVHVWLYLLVCMQAWYILAYLSCISIYMWSVNLRTALFFQSNIFTPPPPPPPCLNLSRTSHYFN